MRLLFFVDCVPGNLCHRSLVCWIMAIPPQARHHTSSITPASPLTIEVTEASTRILKSCLTIKSNIKYNNFTCIIGYIAKGGAMAASVFSLLRSLATHLSLFVLIATIFFLIASFSHIWQDDKAPSALLAEITAPNEETATDAEVSNYIRLLDSQMVTALSTLSSTKDPAQRALLEKRVNRLSSEWCKFMRIQTGRNYKMWKSITKELDG
jgi:hypothetical protein